MIGSDISTVMASSKRQIEIGQNTSGELAKLIQTLECNGGAGKGANEKKAGQRILRIDRSTMIAHPV
jgi:hypothetical protein